MIWIWLVSSLALIFNSIVIVDAKFNKHHNIHDLAILNLAISDMLYGIYLLMIAIVDIQYGQHYAIYDWEWKSSIACQSASILASVSLTMNAACIVEITT